MSTAATAIRHYTDARDKRPENIIANTNRAYHRIHPPRARSDSVPSIHDMFDITIRHFNKNTEKDLRIHLIHLLLLLGTKRFSDLARLWRDERSLRFRISKLDVPAYAREHRTEAHEMLQDLRLLPHRPLDDDEFIIMEFRPFKPKTSGMKGKLWGDWIRLIENRFYIPLCPVHSIARYLHHTNSLRINTTLKCDCGTILTALTDDSGKHPKPAKPLIMSLKQSRKPARHGLQGTTMSGITRRTLLNPLGIQTEYVPYVTRATSASCKIAYKIDIATVLFVGAWTSEATFTKHYRFEPLTPINPARVRDSKYHDWVLARAHQILRNPGIRSNSSINEQEYTGNDRSIALALSTQRQQRNRIQNKKRKRHYRR